MGDNLHQRAVVRQLMQRADVTLETSWPVIYHDLIEQGLKVARRPVRLRTQTKNSMRESEQVKFSARHPLLRANMRVSYTGTQVLQTKSKTILEAMCNATATNFETADFRLPVPDAWVGDLFKTLAYLPDRAGRRPWLLYRPLCARPEWTGSQRRNADPETYAALLSAIRDKFFVISVADFEPGQEWLVGPEPDADVKLHAGQLNFEALAALAKQSDMIFTSSGFAAILGPAVETPTVSIIGGYEDVRCHDSGKKFAPYLSLGPENGCSCWTSACRKTCDKRIEIETAKAKLVAFVNGAVP